MPRALFTSTSGTGHLMPLFPIAHAAGAAGWEVTVAAPPEVEATVTAAGLSFAPLAGIPGSDPRRAEVAARIAEMPQRDGEMYFVRELFGRLNTMGTLPHMRRLVEELNPDVIVSESSECSGGLVSEAAGIPWLRVYPGLTTLPFFDGPLAEGIAEFRGQVSTDAEPRLPEATHIAYMPLELESPELPGVDALRIKDPRFEFTEEAPKDEMIYITFGSEAAQMPFFNEVAQAAIDAVAAHGADALVAVGRHGDPGAFKVPPGVSVKQWVNQTDVMRRASAVVCHGGSGTVLAALSLGVPMVIVPLFADQPYNAERVATNKAGVVVPPGPDLGGRIASALHEVRQSAIPGTDTLKKAIESLPGPEAAVELLSRAGRSWP